MSANVVYLKPQHSVTADDAVRRNAKRLLIHDIASAQRRDSYLCLEAQSLFFSLCPSVGDKDISKITTSEAVELLYGVGCDYERD